MKIVRSMCSIATTVIVVAGATGCGKSKLALELAQRCNGEIISADSMQVYNGLDIITNKVTKEEQQLVSHHLIDFISPLKRFTVTDFATRALPLIDHLMLNGKTPIIVGGTNYYIESLLWKMLIPEENCNEMLVLDKDAKRLEENTSRESLQHRNNDNEPCQEVSEPDLKKSKSEGTQGDDNDDNYHTSNILKMYITPDTVTQIPSSTLHEALRNIDPKMADRLHPNEKRKIIRSLQVYQQQKRKHSEILDEQRSVSGGSPLGGPLRYKNAVILWLQCNQKVLDERLDSRVDKMIEQGLIKELLGFHLDYNQHRLSMNQLPDYTQGIFQSIGFKEFHDYLILSEGDRDSEQGKKLFFEGLESMKLRTRRYSRSQIKWIKNRFLRKDREVPPVYALDVTDLSQWQEKVLQPAIEVVNALLVGDPVKIAPVPIERDCVNLMNSFYCEECKKTVVGTLVWEKHLKSRKHQKVKKRKLAALQNLVATLEQYENNVRTETQQVSNTT